MKGKLDTLKMPFHQDFNGNGCYKYAKLKNHIGRAVHLEMHFSASARGRGLLHLPESPL